MFYVNKTFAVRMGPFQKGLDLILLVATENYLKQQMRLPYLDLHYIDYKEVKSIKPNYRCFEVKRAFNHKDK